MGGQTNGSNVHSSCTFCQIYYEINNSSIQLYVQISLKPDLYLLIKYGQIYSEKWSIQTDRDTQSTLQMDRTQVSQISPNLSSQSGISTETKPDLYPVVVHPSTLCSHSMRNEKIYLKESMCCLLVEHTNQPTAQSTEIFFYEILKEKEMHIIRRWSRFPTTLINRNLYFKAGNNNKFHFQYGVHQGSPISPALFNIYIERVIEELL